jgi:hypothetical protein
VDALLEKQSIYVDTRQDRVVLRVRRLEVEMPYATSFKLAQGLRLASKDAMRYAKEDVNNWQDFAALSDMNKRVWPYIAHPERRVTLHKGVDWRAGWEGENVKIQFGDQLLKCHFTAALKISEWLREAGRQSKAWAGDSSRSIHAAGVLSDAENNYRLGVK